MIHSKENFCAPCLAIPFAFASAGAGAAAADKAKERRKRNWIIGISIFLTILFIVLYFVLKKKKCKSCK